MSCMQGGAGCACPLRPNLSGIPVNFKLVLRCVRLYEHSPCVSPHFPAFPPCSQEVSPLRIQGQVTDKLLIFFHLHDWLLLSQIPHLVDTTQQIPILMHRKTQSADDFFTWEQKYFEWHLFSCRRSIPTISQTVPFCNLLNKGTKYNTLTSTSCLEPVDH